MPPQLSTLYRRVPVSVVSAGPNTRPFGVVCVLVCLLLMVGLAQAKPKDPLEAYNGWKVKSFKVQGLPPTVVKGVVKGMAFEGKWRLIRGNERPDFSVRTLAEDLARMRLLLARNGYPAAQIEPVITPDARGAQLDLLLLVSPGTPVRLGRIELSGWPESVARPDSTNPDVLHIGEIFSDERVSQGKAKLREILLDAGYAEVALDFEIEPMGPGKVFLKVLVEAGDLYHIVDVEIDGCSDDLIPVARRIMNIRSGVEYSQQVLREASLDLRSTQLFRLVVLETAPSGPGDLKLMAHLDNNRMKTLEASVGTWSDNPWMVKSSWTHRNLFGGGVGLDVEGVVATHRIGIGTGVFWLGWLSPRAKSRVSSGFLVEEEDAYRSREVKTEFVQSFRPRNRDIWNVGTTISRTLVDTREAEIEDLPEEQGRLLELWTDMKWDRTDDPLYPTSGGYFKISFTVAPPGFFSEVPYISTQVDGMALVEIVNEVMIAGRFRIGAAKPLGESLEVIANRRFYAGGYNSHRGYGRRELGPKDVFGNSRGGEFVGLAGAEVRFPLVWKFHGALFVDAGQLWATPGVAVLNEIPMATGASVDLRTPLGPLRVGYAHNFANLVPGQPKDLWHFGIGFPW